MEGYIYYATPSLAQREFDKSRIANLQRQRQQLHQHKHSQSHSSDGAAVAAAAAAVTSRPQLERTTSHGSYEPVRANNKNTMDPSLKISAGSVSSSSNASSHSRESPRSLLNNPYELRNGRRCLRDVPYPLPVDLAEVQRQNLRTLLGSTVFSRPVCSPRVSKDVPRKVLELGCGGGYWSSLCHEYFTSLGHPNVSFTGLDIAPVAPNLKKQGVNWTFVQHDMRRMPLPFDDEEFDLIMLKDLSLVIPLGVLFQTMIDDCIRLLREGGTLEIWESDHVLRSLLPHPPPPPSKRLSDHETALQTGTFLISPSTPFAPAQNKYLRQANAWIQEALDRRRLPPTPCARIAQVMYQEPESLADVGIRRVAIPLGELRWEREGGNNPNSQNPNQPHHTRTKSNNNALDQAPAKSKSKSTETGLTADQAALRQTALLTVVQMIESLEPLLKEACGKNSEEWSHWWATMMTNLMDPAKKALSGECLEVGAWWATKIAED
ncbi:hypothetical protein MBLNU230_g1282t1 [Neophaeotheca triangularis]